MIAITEDLLEGIITLSIANRISDKEYEKYDNTVYGNGGK